MKKTKKKNVKRANNLPITVEKNEQVDFMGKVYNDINAIHIDSNDSFDTLLNKFYDVMTKWGICQGTWCENGRTANNPEWCICWAVFKDKIDAQFMWIAIMSDPPKHLLAYGKEPKRKYK